MKEIEKHLPWYKQFWPWFLIALPLTAVIGSMITINLAITDTDGLVKDDYYKEGLAVNQDKARKKMAVDLGIQANCVIDTQTGSIKITLNDASVGHLDKLVAKMIHPTRANNDMSIQLSPIDGKTFIGEVSMDVKPGYWWIRLSPENDSWYVEGRIRLPNEQLVLLK